MNKEEDEIYFLIECPLYDDFRYNIFHKLIEAGDDFNNAPFLAKACVMMCAIINQFIFKK